MAGTNFMSRHSMDHLLATLEQTFREFVTHERIENTLIMRRLQQKMAIKRLACNDRVRDNHEVNLVMWDFILRFIYICIYQS